MVIERDIERLDRHIAVESEEILFLDVFDMLISLVFIGDLSLVKYTNKRVLETHYN